MKYKFKILICTWVSLGFATETKLQEKPTEFANLHAVKSEIYSNLSINELAQLAEVNTANKTFFIDSLKPRLQKAIESKELICEFSWKELQEISKIKELKPLIDEFFKTRLELINLEAFKTDDRKIYLKFEPSSDVRVSISFQRQYEGPAVVMPDLNVETSNKPCQIGVRLDNLHGDYFYTFGFDNFTSEPLPNHQFKYTVHTEVDQNLLKKVYQIGLWLKQEFDLDDSEGGAKKLFVKSEQALESAEAIFRLNRDEYSRLSNSSNLLKGQAKEKMTEYLKPILMGLGIDMKYFKLYKNWTSV